MKHFILSDAGLHTQMLPLSYTRPVAEIRTGILSNAERWKKLLSTEISYITRDYLQEKYSRHVADINCVINASVIADKKLASQVQSLNQGSLVKKGKTIAAVYKASDIVENFSILPQPITEYDGDVHFAETPYHIFGLAGIALNIDFDILIEGKTSEALSTTNTVIGKHPVFIEAGAKAEASIFNTTNGPIYLGKNAEVMEGCMIRGPFALGDYSVLKMGSKIYGPTSIGPHSKVGGELNNVVILGLSNKAHDGFLGNSVIGEWCNLGADTNNSNLKNNYAEVKLWNYEKNRFVNTGLQFCGLIMGDHSKCGINTMFNTGTVVGVSANIFGDGFPRNFIPSFSWGGAAGFKTYQLDKALETVALVMNRRGLELCDTDKKILNTIFEISDVYRSY